MGRSSPGSKISRKSLLKSIEKLIPIFGAMLKKYMEIKGYSVNKIASENGINVDRVTFYYWTTGRDFPDPIMLRQIMNTLKLNSPQRRVLFATYLAGRNCKDLWLYLNTMMTKITPEIILFIKESLSKDIDLASFKNSSQIEELIFDLDKLPVLPTLLQKHIDKQALKDYEFADLAGFPRSTVSYWLNGAHLPEPENLHRIMDALRLNAQERRIFFSGYRASRNIKWMSLYLHTASEAANKGANMDVEAEILAVVSNWISDYKQDYKQNVGLKYAF